MPEDQIQPEKRDDWREVRNYVEVNNAAIAELTHLPLSNRLLKQTHEVLMRGVRGEHKQPGEFRSSQNWIGGSSLADAVFIPPHPESVPELMSDLEKFWHDETITVPHLIRLAIEDSAQCRRPSTPVLVECDRPSDGTAVSGQPRSAAVAVPFRLLSAIGRAVYRDALMRVRVANDLIHWVRFFLQGVAETAAKGRSVFQRILALRTETERQVLALGRRAPNSDGVAAFPYRRPLVSAKDLQEGLNVSQPTANALIGDLTRLGVLREVTGASRNRLYVFETYLALFVK